MLRLIAIIAMIAAAFASATAPVNATTLNVNTAVKTLDSIALDSNKLKAYCDALKELYAAGEDPTKQAEADENLTKVLLSFGPQYQMLLEIYDAVAPESNDSKLLDDAFLKLDSKCEG